jgi:hypothetical protein
MTMSKKRSLILLVTIHSRWALLLAAFLLCGFNSVAQYNNWQRVSPSQVPETGTFWLVSAPDGPPWPMNPYPGCDVYLVK